MATYTDLHAKRPICAKLLDHNQQIIDTAEAEMEDSEYRSTINKMQVGIRMSNTLNCVIYIRRAWS